VSQMSKKKKKCDFGCEDDDIEEKCATCDHPKHYHSPIHPHRCLGTTKNLEGDRKCCHCKKFVSIFYPAQTKRTEVDINAKD